MSRIILEYIPAFLPPSNLVSFEQLVLLMVKLHSGNSSHRRDCFRSPSRFGTCKLVHYNFRSSLVSFCTAPVLIYFLHNIALFALIVNENQDLCCAINVVAFLGFTGHLCYNWWHMGLWSNYSGALYVISCRILVSKMHQFLSPVLHGVLMGILWVCDSS